jgi:hypothetical protein
MIARLKCWLFGHTRGRRVELVTSTSTVPVHTFECRRCGAQWTRKVRKAAAA